MRKEEDDARHRIDDYRNRHVKLLKGQRETARELVDETHSSSALARSRGLLATGGLMVLTSTVASIMLLPEALKERRYFFLALLVLALLGVYFLFAGMFSPVAGKLMRVLRSKGAKSNPSPRI